MYRFKASKYKNSIAKLPKKEDSWTDIKVETPLCFGNHVAASTKYVACNIGSADSGKVGVYDVTKHGRMGTHPSLPAHGAAVTDIEFLPFHHNMLLTASEDTTVKLWQIPDNGFSNENPLNPVKTFSGFAKRPELLCHHSVADNVVGIATGDEVQIWNIDAASSVSSSSCHSSVQSISWSQDGIVIACTTKDKAFKIFDPRRFGNVSEKESAHQNHKDSRVLFLGSSGKILTTGYSNTRTREIKVWDQRNIKSCLQSLNHGSSTGVLMPFYDDDTKLLFVAGKGDTNMLLLEVTEGAQVITQASQASLPDQTKGMALGSKLALDVMGCEVNRLYQLCAKQLIPIKIEVPRRSHSDFAADLFPDTFSDQIVQTAEQWCSGENSVREKASLDPAKRKPLQSDANSGDKSHVITSKNNEIKNDIGGRNLVHRAGEKALQAASPAKSEPKPPKKERVTVSSPKEEAPKNTPEPFAGAKQSKFRHWTGTVLHPSTHITNLPAFTRNVSSACDGFSINKTYAAVPLTSPGGPIGIIELSKAGRAPKEIPTFQNKSAVTDFKWSPFYEGELAVGVDTGVVKIWNIPEEGLKGTESQPNDVLEGHYSKVLCIQYHPLAMDVLASVAMDMNLIIWNLESNEMVIQLSGHDEEVLHMAWSENGKYLATVAKDNKIRVYEPREFTQPTCIGPGPEGSRGARLTWIHDDKMLLVSGFSKNGTRQISVYSVEDLEGGPKENLKFDTSPSTLISFYDHDTNVVFLTGKGDTTMTSCEVTTEPPYFYPTASFSSEQSHQAFGFLSKLNCDVRKVEFARAWRLSKNSMEQVSFKVPRVKMEYFQDDIFPPTRDRSKSTMTADQWFSGGNIAPNKVSVRPADMKPLSEAPKEAPKQRKYESYNAATYKTDEEKKEELLAAMSSKLDLDKQLEQDTMEGVDEDEWDD